MLIKFFTLFFVGAALVAASVSEGYASSSRYRTLFSDRHRQPNLPWRHLASTEEESLVALLEILQGSPTGQKVIKAAAHKAAQVGKTLTDIIRVDDFSKTDTTLSRKFYVRHPEHVVYEEHSLVYLDKDLTVADAVLDLAHELTHYTWRAAFDPYAEDFTVRDLIKTTIEGAGGEVEAYLMECKVWGEIWRGRYSSSNCTKIYDEDHGKFSREKAISLFYQLGQHYEAWEALRELLNLDRQDFPYASNRPTLFVSSYYSLPYPLAAIKEFQGIREKTCRNEERRLRLLREQLAANQASAQQSVYYRLGRRYQQQCSGQKGFAAELVPPALRLMAF